MDNAPTHKACGNKCFRVTVKGKPKWFCRVCQVVV